MRGRILPFIVYSIIPGGDDIATEGVISEAVIINPVSFRAGGGDDACESAVSAGTFVIKPGSGPSSAGNGAAEDLIAA